MTFPGVDMVVALAIVAAIGGVTRFDRPQKLVSYLSASTRACGSRALGPPTTAGSPSRAVATRNMLVEAAWAAARAPGPLRAFFLRVRARRGQHVPAVATARKLAVIIWHALSKGECYVWERPALHAQKLRDLGLKAGHESERGQKGAAHAYNIKSHRDQERRWVEQPREPTPGSSPVGIRAVRTGAHRRRNRGATMKAARQGSRLTPCFDTRSPLGCSPAVWRVTFSCDSTKANVDVRSIATMR
jgi:hypothetical protein